jgi:hypothetical protein
MKNLKTLQTNGLLKSKSYGLGKELFWSLAKKKIVRDLGYNPPKSEIHSYLYEHEKDLGDVFVSLALTETLYTWKGEGDQKKGFRFDRMFQIDDTVRFLERERGTQGREKLRAKLSRYLKHYRETKEQFNVLILAEASEIDFHLSLFGELHLGNHYGSVAHSEFVRDPLNALITTRFGTFSLSN